MSRCLLRSLKVIDTDVDRSATCDLLLTLHGYQEPVSYSFRDNRRLKSKIAKIFSPRVSSTQLLEVGIG